MAIVPFDTLKLAKGLEGGGFTATQASAAVEALADAASTASLATRDALLAVKSELKAIIEQVERKLDHRIEQIERRLDHRIERVEQKIELFEQKIAIRLGGMLVVAVGVMIAALRYFVY